MDPQHFAKLKWRCRRGTKELDSLLNSFLVNHFNETNSELFNELLSLPDTELIHYLLGSQLPESKGLASLVKQIRNNADF